MADLIPKVGIIALGRDTFDVAYADEILSQTWIKLSQLKIDIVGERKILFNVDEARAQLEFLQKAELDIILILQITFTDANMTVEIAQKLDAPLILWSFPEPRTGGRLRLNSFCGINLAAHALSRKKIPVNYIHGLPASERAIVQFMETAKAGAVKRYLKNKKIAVVGDHPDGFDACNYSENELSEILGISVDCYDLIEFLDSAKNIPDDLVAPIYQERKTCLANLETLDKSCVDKTLKVFVALKNMVADKDYKGIAVRCWPEFFTHFGAAACGALAMMNENFIPCGCEADVYGVITSLALQLISDEPVFNTDLVDIDPESNTCVFWHCGQAPIQMAVPNQPVNGTIHSNRKLPLLNEFPLKPGRFTLARFSQGHGKIRLIIGSGEMQSAPLAFSGTAGVAKLDSPIEIVLKKIIREGLEHHTAIAYGEHRASLRKLAEFLKIDVVEMTD